MSNQLVLTGFEAPNEKELSAYNEILPYLQAAAEEMGASAPDVTLKPAKYYSSVYYGNTLAFRLKLRGKIQYIAVPLASKDAVSCMAPEKNQKAQGDFWRVELDSIPISNHTAALANVIRDTINRFPKEWDCCSRYMECSNAKKCVHPDPAFAFGCGYRKILASGQIFYGKNRNI